MKILFLDFDGVLAPINATERDEYGPLFKPEAVEALRLLAEDGWCWVITSNWRISNELGVSEMWQKRGLPGKIVGYTRHLNYNRIEEILDFVGQAIDVNNDDWHVVDDMQLLSGRFTQIDPHECLTIEQAQAIINLYKP